MLRYFARVVQQSSSPSLQLSSFDPKSLKTDLTIASKRVFDVSVVLLGALVIVPMMIVAGLVVWALQGRPILIRHKRVGQGGKVFPCLKFRTMVTDGDAVLRRHLEENALARAEWEKGRKLKDDPRVTPLGRIFRKTSLDELPQLWNVLMGDMSLVGPRPIVREEVRRYGTSIDQYYRVRPGLTGVWQVSGRSDTDYDNRVRLDVEYVRTLSILRDLKIVIMTIPAVLQSRGSY